MNVHYILVPFQREPTPFGLLSALGGFVLRAIHRTTWLTALTVDLSLPFGLLSMLRQFALRAIERVMFFKVLRGMCVSIVDPSFTDCPSGLKGDFLSPETLRRVARDREYDLPSDFLETALASGDECYGILDGDRLAAYGWYARAPTRIGDDLRLHLSSLRSVYRMGYVDFGRVFIARLFGRYLVLETGGCEAFGFRVVPDR